MGNREKINVMLVKDDRETQGVLTDGSKDIDRAGHAKELGQDRKIKVL